MTKSELIKQLRDLTQAGMMDCKKALDDCNDNIEQALQWLREKGVAKAAKKATAIATEGIAKIGISENTAIILELNSQTDFVAKNDSFIKLANEIVVALLESEINDLETANQLQLPSGSSIEQSCQELTSKIGEKIALRRFIKINKQNNETFGHYEHSNGKIAVLLVLSGKVSQEVSKNVAMHAAAMAPKFLNRTKVDQEWLNNETKILIEQTIAEGKPKDKAEMIVKGRTNKMLAEVCLDDQSYVKEPSLTISQYLKNNSSQAIEYIRFEVGEGIEKKEVDFATEVASQMNQ